MRSRCVHAGLVLLAIAFAAHAAGDAGEPTCEDLSGIDFGPCDAVLGFGVIVDECQEISGCESPVSLFATLGECQGTCFAIPVEDHTWGRIKARFDSDE